MRDRANKSLVLGGADPDRALLARAAEGDESAVRELFRAHLTRLHRQAARILGADDADVEDVVQQAFLAALDGARDFDGRSTVATWLFGITTRRALDAARSRWRRHRWLRMGEGLGWRSEVAAPDVAHLARSDAEAMLAHLTPEQRLVFVLHDVEGYTFAEISGMTGLGISSLHGRLVAARKRLDRRLAQGGERE